MAKKLLPVIILTLSLVAGLILVDQKTQFFQKAFGESADIHVNAINIVNIKNESWRNLAQGGEEKGRQLLPVVNQTRDLKPEYIRIDHVFDYYTLDELDQVVRDITSTGAKPFISLSYMPVNIAKDGNITNNPNNWSDWEVLVTKLVERVSGRNGLNISDVYYEVWNEPDLFGKYKTFGSKNYLELYTHTENAVKRAKNVNNYKFGGPATTGYYQNWMDSLVKLSRENNLRLDFLSWHRYSKDIESFEEDFKKTFDFQPNYELIITEAGPNSENDKVYDNNVGAMHTLATIVALEGKVDKVFSFEIKDGAGPEKYWGRWGMLTNDKYGTPEIKPRYRAIQFLNRLIGGRNLEITGNGSWVRGLAKNINGKIVLMLVNYDKNGTHVESVPVTITNLPSNNFVLKRTDFGSQTIQEDLVIENGTWQTTIYMSANSAVIFELTER